MAFLFQETLIWLTLENVERLDLLAQRFSLWWMMHWLNLSLWALHLALVLFRLGPFSFWVCNQFLQSQLLLCCKSSFISRLNESFDLISWETFVVWEYSQLLSNHPLSEIGQKEWRTHCLLCLMQSFAEANGKQSPIYVPFYWVETLVHLISNDWFYFELMSFCGEESWPQYYVRNFDIMIEAAWASFVSQIMNLTWLRDYFSAWLLKWLSSWLSAVRFCCWFNHVQ